MQGIYIHIPFCRQACRYCDFFFSVSLRYLDEFTDSLLKEIMLRSPGAADTMTEADTRAETLYLGGGTPSLLSESHLKNVVTAIRRNYTYQKEAEWTIECNPDDLSAGRLRILKSLGFNRLSIGVQSFQEGDLELMRRSHHADQAMQAVREAADQGFENISIDLIYGIPGQEMAVWEKNLETALSLPISHISAYHLTYEPGTVFDHWRKKGRLVPVHEDVSVMQYRVMREKLLSAGFEHYEVSNFALKGRRSAHNMIYWSGKPYTGYGPSAHSYDGTARRWNLSSLKGYMEGIAGNGPFHESEQPGKDEQYHDYLITSLRTSQGADPGYMEQQYGREYREHFEHHAQTFLGEGTLVEKEGRIAIHPDQWLITDHILRKLFMD